MIWITRPAEEAERLANALALHGVDACCFPLLKVTHKPFDVSCFQELQGLVVTSRNGLRGAVNGDLPKAWFKLPLFAVGAASGDLAKTLGFEDVRVPPLSHGGQQAGQSGGAVDLMPLIEAAGFAGKSLLQLRGDQVAFDLKGALAALDIELVEVLTYQIKEITALSTEFIEILKAGQIEKVCLMSPRTARVYDRLMMDAGLKTEMQGLEHVCLSLAVAESLPGFCDDETSLRVMIADNPTQEAMIEALLSEGSD